MCVSFRLIYFQNEQFVLRVVRNSRLTSAAWIYTALAVYRVRLWHVSSAAAVHRRMCFESEVGHLLEFLMFSSRLYE